MKIWPTSVVGKQGHICGPSQRWSQDPARVRKQLVHRSRSVTLVARVTQIPMRSTAFQGEGGDSDILRQLEILSRFYNPLKELRFKGYKL